VFVVVFWCQYVCVVLRFQCGSGCVKVPMCLCCVEVQMCLWLCKSSNEEVVVLRFQCVCVVLRFKCVCGCVKVPMRKWLC